MCFFKGYLYFNDRNGLKRRKLDGSGPVEAVSVPGSKSFNDAGCDDNYVYMTGENSIYRVDAEGKSDKFLTLKGVNGIKSFKGKLFAVTTAKDAVRLPPGARDMVTVIDVALAFDRPDDLDRLLDHVLGPAPR